jgi:hypothetical protein
MNIRVDWPSTSDFDRKEKLWGGRVLIVGQELLRTHRAAQAKLQFCNIGSTRQPVTLSKCIFSISDR